VCIIIFKYKLISYRYTTVLLGETLKFFLCYLLNRGVDEWTEKAWGNVVWTPFLLSALMLARKLALGRMAVVYYSFRSQQNAPATWLSQSRFWSVAMWQRADRCHTTSAVGAGSRWMDLWLAVASDVLSHWSRSSHRRCYRTHADRGRSRW
jgi:hypothetical protein